MGKHLQIALRECIKELNVSQKAFAETVTPGYSTIKHILGGEGTSAETVELITKGLPQHMHGRLWSAFASDLIPQHAKNQVFIHPRLESDYEFLAGDNAAALEARKARWAKLTRAKRVRLLWYADQLIHKTREGQVVDAAICKLRKAE